jgi:hypothetical protein
VILPTEPNIDNWLTEEVMDRYYELYPPIPTVEEEKFTQNEIRAVGGNISAIYIVRAIHKRSALLKKLTQEVEEMVNANSKVPRPRGASKNEHNERV